MSIRRVELEFRRIPDRAAQLSHDMVVWHPFDLPRLDEEAIPPRWQTRHWVPFQSRPLVRHVSDSGDKHVVTLGEEPPPGFRQQWHLGAVWLGGHPETVRLVLHADARYTWQEDWRPLPSGGQGLGFVNTVPLPMLDALERRVVRDTGEEVLVCGATDPLRDLTDHLETLGFIDSYPIAPRVPPPAHGTWTMTALHRRLDLEGHTHRYAAALGPQADAVCLGGLHRFGGPAYAQLRRTADGRLVSDLLPDAGTLGRQLRTDLRWAFAPLRWGGAGRSVRVTTLRARLRAIRAQREGAFAQRDSREQILGYLRREPVDGWSPLYSATHPVVGDQFLTRSRLEATDMGYVVDGVLGLVRDEEADGLPGPRHIPWASWFGHKRRYEEQDPAAPLPPRRPAAEPPEVERHDAVHGAGDEPTPPPVGSRLDAAVLLEPIAASGLAAVGLEPGARRNEGPRDAPGVLCCVAVGADAALLAITAPALREWAKRLGWRLVLSAQDAIGMDDLARELLAEHGTVCAVAPTVIPGPEAGDPAALLAPGQVAAGTDEILVARAGDHGAGEAEFPRDGRVPDGVRCFGDITPYARRRQAMMAAALERDAA